MTKDIRSSDKKILRDATQKNTTNLTKDTSHSVIAISEYES